MLTLINTLSLATALTLQPKTDTIQITLTMSNDTSYLIQSKSNLVKDDKQYAYSIILFNSEAPNDKKESIDVGNYKISNSSGALTKPYTTYNKIGIGYLNTEYDIEKYKEFNTLTIPYKLYENTITNFEGDITHTFEINIRSTTFMEELLTALTTAVQSAVSIFVQGFGGLTQIFYNGTEITFIGGILVVGLAVMFLMMFLRWIVSFVKGI